MLLGSLQDSNAVPKLSLSNLGVKSKRKIWAFRFAKQQQYMWGGSESTDYLLEQRRIRPNYLQAFTAALIL